MAIDTALKRRSAGAVGRRAPGAGVTPDALKPVAWRQSAAWGYAGIAPAAPAAAASTESGSIRISVAQARLRLVRTRIRVERPDV